MTVKRLKLKTLEEIRKAVVFIKQKAIPSQAYDGKHAFLLQYEKEFRRKDINGNSFYNFTIYGINTVNQTTIVNVSKVIAGLFNLKYDDKKNCIVGYDSIPQDIEAMWRTSEPTAPELKFELVY